MSDYHRDEDKARRLGEPTPRTEPCSACRGYGTVRRERCPECDGGVTREAQLAYLTMLVECAAAEAVPRVERTVFTVEQLAEGLGGCVFELFRLPLGPGDVLVWHLSNDIPAGKIAEQMRFLKRLLPRDKRPSAFVALRPGEHLDAFLVGGGASDEGIVDGLRGIGGRLSGVRPKPLEGALGMVAGSERSVRVSPWHETLDELLGEDECGATLAETLKTLAEVCSRHGLVVAPEPTQGPTTNNAGEAQSFDPEFVWATRSTSGRRNDNLDCVCEEQYQINRKATDPHVDCDCGRTLRRVQLVERGSKWAVNP